MKKIKLLTILICLQCSFSYSAYALDCDNELQMSNILSQVNLDYDSSALFSCDTHPQNKEQTLIAYAVQDPTVEDIGIGDFHLYILSLDNKTNHVSYFYPVEQTLVSDAIELSNIQWDFSPYNISLNQRAIGLRLKYWGRSRANPYSSEVLNLYDLDHKKQILDRLITSLYSAETDTRCNADIKERHSILVMQPQKTNGYFDIRIRSQIEQYEEEGDEENCNEVKRHHSKQSFILKFDGHKYQIPKPFLEDYEY